MSNATSTVQKGIQISDAALKQLKALREQQGQDLVLRVGVRQGGCSGMSYLMDFTDSSGITEIDEVYDYEGFQVVCDKKSLLYIYGMLLDYSTALIGGGFNFTNPNASQTCGCGNSFSA
ncbi:MAG: HesB/IscA family protein [Prochlorotrichaceae cyanobacterium]